MSMLRSYFARQENPHAGGDLDNAQRIGSVIWGLLVALAIVLVPLNPPTEPFGASGWAVVAVLIAAGIGITYQLRRSQIDNWDTLLVAAYGTAIAIGVVQWLSGGQTAPFRGLLLLPVLFVAATQPPRRIGPFMFLVFLMLSAPFIYDTWDASRAEGMGATFVIWCALTVGASLLMMGVRAQRVTLEAAGEEARAEARIDSLTGLPNRRAFDELLITEVARARRLDLPLSLAMVDIVKFKELNDRWSYAEGDRCLTEVADALRKTLRQPDFCFRWGGDEFALILGGTHAEETWTIAERLEAEVSSTCTRPDETPVRVRFATAELGDEMTPRELTEMAGLALTAAKLDDDQTTNAMPAT
jgi:diguanylate cyclase (GGDEF)-like protein